MNVIADYLEDAEREYRAQATALAQMARTLAEQMTRVVEIADRAAREGVDDARFSNGINSLGEVQGRGMDVDRLCATLSQQRDAVKRLRYAARRQEDPTHDDPAASTIALVKRDLNEAVVATGGDLPDAVKRAAKRVGALS